MYEEDKMEIIWIDERGCMFYFDDIEWMEGFD